MLLEELDPSRWGSYRLDQIKPVAVEKWLGSMKRARGTKAKIRNLASGGG
jgi:hypothetical protein